MNVTREYYNSTNAIPTKKNLVIEGMIGETVTKNSKSSCWVSNAKIYVDQKIYHYDKILVYLKHEVQVKYGNCVRIEGTYKQFSKARNPGNFDEEEYYYSIGVACKFYEDSLTVMDDSYHSIMEWLINIRKTLKETFYQLCNEKEASIFSAILLGEKGLDETVNTLYKANGISHILSISGLHISIIGLGVYQILRRKFLFPLSSVGAIVIMIGYGLMTGGAVSLIRAITMFLMKLIADVFGRTYDMITATAVAAVLILIENPYCLMNTGFQLSFVAIVAIAAFSPIMELYFFLSHPFLKSLNISILVTILTTPIILNSYFTIPTYAVLINLLVIPLTGMLLLSGIVASAIGTFINFLGCFLIGVGCTILRFYEFLCNVFLLFPFATVTVGKLSLFRMVIYYGIVIVVTIGMWVINKRNLDSNFWKVRYCKRGIVFAAFLLLFITVFFKPLENDLQITIIDVGQGDSILIQTPNNKSILIDGGSADIANVAKYRLIPAMKSKGIDTLDYVFITHMDSDHISGLLELLDHYKEYDMPIKKFVLAKNAIIEEDVKEFESKAQACNIAIEYISTGAEFLDLAIKLECLHPSESFHANDRNTYSLVLQLQYKEFNMLFTGDLDYEGEKELIKNNMLKDYDVLKVAHHGSKTSSSQEFLEIIKPEVAFISCGVNNRYGHPSKETLTKLNTIDCIEYSTNECGAIHVSSDGKNYKISTYLQE